MMAIEVQQAQLDLVFEHEFQHKAIQERLTQQFRRALQKFDPRELDTALVADENLFFIDKIQVDLGEINWENLEQHFSQLLLKQLRQALLQALERYQSPCAEAALCEVISTPLVVDKNTKKAISTTEVDKGLGGGGQPIAKLIQQLVVLLNQLMAASQLTLAAINLVKQWLVAERQAGITPIVNRHARFKQLVALMKSGRPDHRCKQWQLALLHDIAQAPVFALPSCWVLLARVCQHQIQASTDRITLASAWRSLLVTLQLAGVSTPGLASWLKPRRKRWYRRIQVLAEGQLGFQPTWLEQANASVIGYQQLVSQLQRFQRLKQALENSKADVEQKYWQKIQHKIQADIPQPPSVLAALWVMLEAFIIPETTPKKNPNPSSERVSQQQVLNQLDLVMVQLQLAIDLLSQQLIKRLSEPQLNFIDSLRQPFLKTQVKQWLPNKVLNSVISNTKNSNQSISKKLAKSVVNPVFFNQKVTSSDIDSAVDNDQAVLGESANSVSEQVADSLSAKKELLLGGLNAKTSQAEQESPLANLLQTLGQLSRQADELTEQLRHLGGECQADRVCSNEGSILLSQPRVSVDADGGVQPTNNHPWYTERAGVVLLWPMMPALVCDLVDKGNQHFTQPQSQWLAWFRLWLAAHPEYWVEWILEGEGEAEGEGKKSVSASAIEALLDQAAAELDPLFMLLVGLELADGWGSDDMIPLKKQRELFFQATDWNTELATIHLLLKRFIQQWPALKQTSPMGLSHLFFNRDGVVTRQETGWQLTVSPKAQDVLLQTLPWPKSIIRLPWINGLINSYWD